MMIPIHLTELEVCILSIKLNHDYKKFAFSVSPVERRDFLPDAILRTIQPDEDGIQEFDFNVSVPIVDDVINEPEELFIIVLSVESSQYSDGLTVNPTRRSSLCRIFDNDGELE